MPLIKPDEVKRVMKRQYKIQEEILEEAIKYCKWANIKKLDEFIEKSIIHVLSKDKEFKTYLESFN